MRYLLSLMALLSAFSAYADSKELNEWVSEYITVQQGTQTGDSIAFAAALARKGRLTSLIAEKVFASSGSQAYLDALAVIDSRFNDAPEAIYDLGRSLQQRWETKYGGALADRRKYRIHASGTSGALAASVLALGAAVYFKPTLVPKYFQLIRAFIPVAPIAGKAAGAQIAGTINSTGFLDREVPVSPAHVMHLGLAEGPIFQDEQEMVREALVTLGSVGATMAVTAQIAEWIQVIRWMNVAVTPAKINPYVMAASLVIFFGIEKGAQSAVVAYDYHSLKDDVTQGIERVKRYSHRYSSDDELILFYEVNQLVRACTVWINSMSQPIVAEFERYRDESPRYEVFERNIAKIMSTSKYHAMERGLREAASAIRDTGREYFSQDADFIDSLVSRNRENRVGAP